MNKYNKIQATLKALSNPAIGIDSISQLKLIIDLGSKLDFTGADIRRKPHDKHHLHNKLRNKGMFIATQPRTKTSPSRHTLSQKGRSIYDTVVGKSRPSDKSDALQRILNIGLNRFDPCLLLIRLAKMGTYTRTMELGKSNLRREEFMRKAGLCYEIYTNDKGKAVLGLTDKGKAMMSNLFQLVV